MAKAKPTRTTNRLHFDDLDPRRFEDLCHAIIFPLRQWAKLSHLGRTGTDDGIDIHGVEQTDDGETRQWVIQCKRYKSITPKQAQDALDAGIATTTAPVDVFLLVVGCDVRKETQDKFRAHAAKKGVGEAIIWDATYLESTLYANRKDLLFTYFGVDVRDSRQNNEALVKRRIQLQTKMKKDFRDAEGRRKRHGEWVHRFPFDCSNIIIRDVNDKTYPNYAPMEAKTISPWFKVEPFDFYHNGIEVILNLTSAILDSDSNWDIAEYKDPRLGNYPQVKVWAVGRIPFDGIVTYDMSSNEYGHGPFIYCRFDQELGEPYESKVYYTVQGTEEDETQYSVQLQPEKRRGDLFPSVKKS